MRAAAAPLPMDIRLMNAVANSLFALAGVAVLVLALMWLGRQPLFALRGLRIDGELSRTNVATIRANALPHLTGNFWSFDLQRGRDAFEAVPWVRQAVVHRVWPNRIAVTLHEHHAVALWVGEDGNDRLVNREGQVFEANVGDVEDENLPRLSGPEGSSAQMLAMHLRLVPLLQLIDAQIETLKLSHRGSYRAELDTGAVIELGRGSEQEVVARTERFVRTLAQVNERFQRPLEYADLRHADGYAVRLKGITTTLPTAGKK